MGKAEDEVSLLLPTEAAMQLTPTITFRGIRHSRGLESDILARIAKLEQYYPSVMGCRVVVESRERHHGIHVRIDLTVPGAEIVVSYEATLHGAAQDLDATKLFKAAEPDPARKYALVAVHEACDIARRRLQDLARRQRGGVNHLKIGTLVSYVEEAGDKGPQASSVKIMHPHRSRSAAAAGPNK